MPLFCLLAISTAHSHARGAAPSKPVTTHISRSPWPDSLSHVLLHTETVLPAGLLKGDHLVFRCQRLCQAPHASTRTHARSCRRVVTRLRSAHFSPTPTPPGLLRYATHTNTSGVTRRILQNIKSYRLSRSERPGGKPRRRRRLRRRRRRGVCRESSNFFFCGASHVTRQCSCPTDMWRVSTVVLRTTTLTRQLRTA